MKSGLYYPFNYGKPIIMDKCTVIVIGNDQARFFILEEAEWPEYESGPDLVEQSLLIPHAKNEKSPFWQNIVPKSGQQDSAENTSNYIFDKKFAQKITGEIISLIRVNQSSRLILVANPKIIVLVRRFFTPTMFNNLQIQELHREIGHLSSLQIHNYLAAKQLIPACQKVVYPA